MKIVFKVILKDDSFTISRYETLDEFDSFEEAEKFIELYLQHDNTLLAKYPNLFLQIEKRYYKEN